MFWRTTDKFQNPMEKVLRADTGEKPESLDECLLWRVKEADGGRLATLGDSMTRVMVFLETNDMEMLPAKARPIRCSSVRSRFWPMLADADAEAAAAISSRDGSPEFFSLMSSGWDKI